MGIKVKDILYMIELARPILEHYRESTVTEMMVDLALKSGAYPQEVAPGMAASKAGGTGYREDSSLAPGHGAGPQGSPAADIVPTRGASGVAREVETEPVPATKARETGLRAEPGSERRASSRPGPNKGSRKKAKIEFDLAKVLGDLEAMDTTDISTYLRQFLKKHLDVVAAVLKLGVPASYTKGLLITAITNYYGQKDLPNKMARRAPADDEVFMEEMRRKLGFDS